MIDSKTMFLAHTPLPQGEDARQTFGQFFESGGPLMWVIAAFSVFAVACALERYLRLRRGAICPPRIKEAVQKVVDGKSDEAEAIAIQTKSPAGRILLAGVRRQGFSLDEVERAMQDQGHKEIDRMRGRVRAIQLVANIAPLLGLLGTVWGIADAFHRIVDSGMGKPENLAAGIELALTTTIAGLCVAIPMMVIAAHLQARVRKLALHTDEVLAPAVEPLARSTETSSHAA